MAKRNSTRAGARTRSNQNKNKAGKKPAKSFSAKRRTSDDRRESTTRTTRYSREEKPERESFSDRKRKPFNKDERKSSFAKEKRTGSYSSKNERSKESRDERQGFKKRSNYADRNERPQTDGFKKRRSYSDQEENRTFSDKRKSAYPREERNKRSDIRSSDSKPRRAFPDDFKKRTKEEGNFTENEARDFRSKKSFIRENRNYNSERNKKSFDKESRSDFSDRNKKPFAREDRNDYTDKRNARKKFADHDRPKSFTEKRVKEAKQYTYDAVPKAEPSDIRLNRYIANSGICSRRDADEKIKMGLVTVNGTTITEMGFKVKPGDVVKYEGKTLRAEKPVYILMNKPKGFLTTTDDPDDRRTVMEIIAPHVKERIYPVGRLDRNTTGLLLLTNDGELAEQLSHPSYNVKKIYKVELDRPLAKADFDKIAQGVQLEEGRAMVDDMAIISDDGRTVGLELHIGWNRVVRRIFESLEYQVIKLDRTVYAGLDKKDLPRGSFRHLNENEVVRLKHFKKTPRPK
ncbi:MAG: pseudouridine synthase [Cyclobacteriaceae bacterium]|jgi:23S rRNA pseudouridine2605 synthase|nr:pseudouridine synthase [Cyclobacteriaceae bacterium]